MTYVPTYSEVEEEIVSVTLNLSNYVTQKEFKNVIKFDTSDFALKVSVAEIKKKVDDIDVDKIDFIDELQVKNFVEDSYLSFKPEYIYFKITGIKSVLSWKSIGLSDETLKSIGHDYFPELLYDKERTYLNFRKDVSTQEKICYSHDHIVNFYIIYSMPYITYKSAPDTIGQCLFGATDYNKKQWSGYGVAFGKQHYLHKDSGKNANNVVILGADLSDSIVKETKKSNILILGKGSVQINNSTIQAKSGLKTNCTLPQKFILSVHYNGDDSYLFVNNIQQYKFKAKDSEIKTRKVCLGGFSNALSNFTAISKIYHFSVDYQLATIDEIQKIQKHNI